MELKTPSFVRFMFMVSDDCIRDKLGVKLCEFLCKKGDCIAAYLVKRNYSCF